jgi:large subunit ribosomal protein L6
MSRIGKLPIVLPSDVDFSMNDNLASIKGPFGDFKLMVPGELTVEIKDRKVFVTVKESSLKSRSLHGAVRTALYNDISGVSKKFEINLNLVGVGYRCEATAKIATLRLGYSHPIEMIIPEGVSVKVENNTSINISGAKKETISQFAAQIRSYRPPEPYNGKGVLYKDEIIIRKAGKSGKK